MTEEYIKSAIQRFEYRLSHPATTPEQRMVFKEALKNARIRLQEVQSGSAGQQSEQTQALASEKPPVTREEASAEQVAAYLAARDKGVTTPQNAQQGQGSADQKKTPAPSDNRKAESGAYITNSAGRVVVFEVKIPDQHVPSYRFTTRKGTVEMKPGEIKQTFRCRMNDLEVLKKPIAHSVVLPQLVAWYEALCMYEKRELDLEYFGFYSQRKQQIFEIIRERAKVEIGPVRPALDCRYKPRFSKRVTGTGIGRNRVNLRRSARQMT